MTATKTVLICQSKTCCKAGAANVISVFRANALASAEIVASGCLGQCGNGPMVLVLPEEVWYCRVHPDEVLTVIDRHLHHNRPIKAMLYPKFHSQN
jgi:(2Fe-2S) ferredoxin